MKLEHSLIPYTKVNLKWINDIKVRPENDKRTRVEHSLP